MRSPELEDASTISRNRRNSCMLFKRMLLEEQHLLEQQEQLQEQDLLEQ